MFIKKNRHEGTYTSDDGNQLLESETLAEVADGEQAELDSALLRKATARSVHVPNTQLTRSLHHFAGLLSAAPQLRSAATRDSETHVWATATPARAAAATKLVENFILLVGDLFVVCMLQGSVCNVQCTE